MTMDEPNGAAAKADCKCNEATLAPVFAGADAPDDATLDSVLAALEGDGSADYGGELELEAADLDLDEDFELEDLGGAGESGPALGELIVLAERNPGLKITISF